MIRLGKNVFSSVLACAAAAALSACGGGSHGNALPVAVQPPATVSPSSLVTATFKITIPVPATSSTSSNGRRPSYISAATKSIRINMTATSSGVAIIPQFNVLTPVTNASGNSPGAPCTGSGPWTCLIAVQVPPGNDTFTFTSYDDATGTGTGASHILSQQVQLLGVVLGKANAYTVTFDAQVGPVATGISVVTSGSTSNFAGPLNTAIPNASQVAIISPPTSGSNSQNFTVTIKDAAGKTIIGPGQPVMAVTTTGNTDITVSNVVQENNSGSTPYSFTLTAPAASASVTSTTPTTVSIAFTGANAPTDGISAITQTLLVSNAKLLAVSGGTPSQINLYGYGDGQLVQFGSTITSAGSLSSHNASEVQFDNAENLYVADFGNAAASAVFKIPRANLQNATPAATQITAPAGNPKKLEPWYMNFMDVAGDGTITIAQNSNNFSDPVSGGTMATMPDTILVASPGSSTFTLGWNNIGTTGFSSGCQCLGAAMSIAALTNTSHAAAFGVAAPSFTGPQTPGPNGYVAIVYFANTAGTTTIACDNASGTTTSCYEADSTSNADFVQQSWDVWDYTNQKLVAATDDSTKSTFQLLDFTASGGVVSTTSTVLDTVSVGTNSGFAYPMAVSRHGRLSSQYVFTGAGGSQRVNVYDNSSGTRVVNGLADTPTIGGGSSMTGTGFVSDATTDALVVVGKDASSNNVLRVYSLASSRLASFTLPFAPLDLGLAAQSHSQRAVRRGDRRSSF